MKPVLTLCAQPLFEARGSPIRVRAFLEALGEAGVPVEAITLPIGPSAELPPTVRLRRAPNFLFARSVAIGPSLPKLLFGSAIAAIGLARALFRRFGVVHGIEEMGLPAWIIARLTGARFVFEKHSDPASHLSASSVRRGIMAAYAAVERFVCRRADVVVATGPGLAEQARSYGSCAAIRVIDDVPSSRREPDPARIPAWRERFGVREGETVFAYIGSFAGYQGVPLFLDAVDRALPARPDLRVVLVGGGDQREAIRGRAERAGYGGRLAHFPAIDPDEVPDFLASCDVLVSPRLEGNNTPLKVLDYLRAGRCILAADTEANRLVLDETVARLAPAGAEALAASMGVLADDPDLRKRLGEAGRRRFEERFGFGRFRDAILEVFAADGGAGKETPT